MPSDIQRALLKGPFIASSSQDDSTCAITSSSLNDGSTKLYFTCPGQSAKNRVVEDSALERVVNKLSEAIFSNLRIAGNEDKNRPRDP